MKNVKTILLLTLLLLPVWTKAQLSNIARQLEIKYGGFVSRHGDGTADRPFYYLVESNGKRGVCDATGREIISPKYESVYRLGDGTADRPFYYSVKSNGKHGVCDATGREIISPKYDESVFYRGSIAGFATTLNGKFTSLDIYLSPDGKVMGSSELSHSGSYESELSAILAKSLLTQDDVKKLDEDSLNDFFNQNEDMRRGTLMTATNLDDYDDGFYFRCTHELARMGDNWALYEIGRLYAIGKGTPMNMAKAKTCLRAAAENSKSHGGSEAAELLKSLK